MSCRRAAIDGRAALLFAGVLLILITGAARLVQIERVDGPGLRARAERTATRDERIIAQRGDILDARGRTLAGSVHRPSIYCDPSLARDLAFTAHSLAPTLGLDGAELAAELAAKRDGGRQFVWIKRAVSDAECAAVRRVIQQRRLRSVHVRYEPVRDYPFKPAAAQVVGFVGMQLSERTNEEEPCGLAGIEYRYNELLRGQDGRRELTVDVLRRDVRQHAGTYEPPRDGASVVLTLDLHIQQCAERHLNAAVEEFGAEWGIAVVLDPHSGEVLALAGAPSYDQTQPIPAGLSPGAQEAWKERFKVRAITDYYEPGSIFKPFISAPALQDGLTRLDEVWQIDGPVHRFGRRSIRDVHAYEQLTTAEVIAFSSNIGMGLLGERTGNVRLFDYVTRFGFGRGTGIRLNGEQAGQVHALADWTSYSTQSVPIGQEIGCTSLQLASAFAVFANGGVLYRPRVVRGVIAADGTTLEDDSAPAALRQVLRPEVAEQFRMAALVRVCQPDATGRKAVVEGYQLFGKTGTAQVADPRGGGYLESTYTGSFLAGAPAGRPRVVVLVSLRKRGKREYYGGTIAAPAAAKIIGDVLEYLQVPPEVLPAAPTVNEGQESWQGR